MESAGTPRSFIEPPNKVQLACEASAACGSFWGEAAKPMPTPESSRRVSGERLRSGNCSELEVFEGSTCPLSRGRRGKRSVFSSWLSFKTNIGSTKRGAQIEGKGRKTQHGPEGLSCSSLVPMDAGREHDAPHCVAWF